MSCAVKTARLFFFKDYRSDPFPGASRGAWNGKRKKSNASESGGIDHDRSIKAQCNPAADGAHLGRIFATTTLAPAFATVTAMIFTWIKNGAPDVSMSLNGALAGLVAITAGCDNVDAVGAIIIGVCAGIIVCAAVLFIENKLKVDDPVGAVAVHGCCGLFGTLAVGLFDYNDGLFYGGGLHHLGIQALGVVCIAGWTIVTMTIVFMVIKKTVGLRVSEEEELAGLDPTEHGLESSYPDFQPKNYKF